MENLDKGIYRAFIFAIVVFVIPVIEGIIINFIGNITKWNWFLNEINTYYPNGINIGGYWEVATIFNFGIFMLILVIYSLNVIGED